MYTGIQLINLLENQHHNLDYLKKTLLLSSGVLKLVHFPIQM